MTTESAPTAELLVQRAELAEALKTIRRVGDLKKAGEAIISFDGEMVRIQLGGASVAATASGDWPAQP